MEAFVVQKAGKLFTINYVRDNGDEIDLIYDGDCYTILVNRQQQTILDKNNLSMKNLVASLFSMRIDIAGGIAQINNILSQEESHGR